jgi:hypothetical protein
MKHYYICSVLFCYHLVSKTDEQATTQSSLNWRFCPCLRHDWIVPRPNTLHASSCLDCSLFYNAIPKINCTPKYELAALIALLLFHNCTYKMRFTPSLALQSDTCHRLMWSYRGVLLLGLHVVHPVLTNESLATESWWCDLYLMLKNCHYQIPNVLSHGGITIAFGVEKISLANSVRSESWRYNYYSWFGRNSVI